MPAPSTWPNAFEKPVWARQDQELTALSVTQLAQQDKKVSAVYGDGKDVWGYLDLTAAWPQDKGMGQKNLDALAQWVKDQVQSELGD